MVLNCNYSLFVEWYDENYIKKKETPTSPWAQFRATFWPPKVTILPKIAPYLDPWKLVCFKRNFRAHFREPEDQGGVMYMVTQKTACFYTQESLDKFFFQVQWVQANFHVTETVLYWEKNVVLILYTFCFLLCCNMSHVMRKPVYAICEQQRRRSACTSAQSDQCLCYSLTR